MQKIWIIGKLALSLIINLKQQVMTKAQMVEKIQVAEAEAWKELQQAKRLWGQDDALTKRISGKWSALYDLREALGIDSLSVQRLIDLELLAA